MIVRFLQLGQENVLLLATVDFTSSSETSDQIRSVGAIIFFVDYAL